MLPSYISRPLRVFSQFSLMTSTYIPLVKFNCKIMNECTYSAGYTAIPKRIRVKLVRKEREWLLGRQLEAIPVHRKIMRIKHVSAR